jgi:urease alpha subunit
MGQASNTRNDVALDTVITNVVIIDAILGIVKADLGIKVKFIYLLYNYLNNSFRMVLLQVLEKLEILKQCLVLPLYVNTIKEFFAHVVIS